MDDPVLMICSCAITLVLVLYVRWAYDMYKRNKATIEKRTDVVKIQPSKGRFLYAWSMYYLAFLIPAIPLIWLINHDDMLLVTGLIFGLGLLMAFPVYPLFTLVIDGKSIEGPGLWKRRRARTRLDLNTIRKDRILRRRIGKIFGIVIISSEAGEKILALGLNGTQVAQILNLCIEE